MSNTAEHSTRWNTEPETNYRDDTVEKAADLEHMLNLSSHQRTAIWRQIVADPDSDYSNRAIGATIFKPFRETVDHVVPNVEFKDNRSAYAGHDSIRHAMSKAQYRLEAAFKHPDDMEPDYDQMAESIEAAYRNASAITAEYTQRFNGKSEEAAQWTLSQYGALDNYLSNYERYNTEPEHEYWIKLPQNFSTMEFINEFPHEEQKLFNTLFHPTYQEYLTNRWDDDDIRMADVELINNLYHSAMEHHPMEHTNNADDQSAGRGTPTPQHHREQHHAEVRGRPPQRPHQPGKIRISPGVPQGNLPSFRLTRARADPATHRRLFRQPPRDNRPSPPHSLQQQRHPGDQRRHPTSQDHRARIHRVE